MSDPVKLKASSHPMHGVQSRDANNRRTHPPTGRADVSKFHRKTAVTVALALLLSGAAVGLYFIENPPGDGPDTITDAEVARFQATAMEDAAKGRLRPESASPGLQAAGVGVSIPKPAERLAAGTRANLEHRDRKLRAAVTGKWDLPKQTKGDYRMTLREDNTGTLAFTPNWKYRALLRLWRGAIVFNIRWELKHGHMDMWSLSGTPKHAFETAVAHEGKRKFFRVEKAGPKRLVLKNLKDGKVDDWRRLR